jgi:hypothetical protein
MVPRVPRSRSCISHQHHPPPRSPTPLDLFSSLFTPSLLLFHPEANIFIYPLAQPQRRHSRIPETLCTAIHPVYCAVRVRPALVLRPSTRVHFSTLDGRSLRPCPYHRSLNGLLTPTDHLTECPIRSCADGCVLETTEVRRALLLPPVPSCSASPVRDFMPV